MLKMTRLRLINWHNFQDDIIDFKNITYLLGVNAVGKTTIMDGIRYCLTTNKDFNTAGNKKSGRTLLGSVHQKQRAEDSYLRPGHTVSYIGIEFYDENIKKYFVIIARVESETPKQDLRGVAQDWYITKPGYMLEDIPFFNTKQGKRPMDRNGFKLPNKGMDRASNQADARRRICRVLGIGEAESPLGKKFNEVFHMGTSLEDIKDIREFIYSYILPEPEMNIGVLQKDMKELERLQEILQEAQEREALLGEINTSIAEAKKLWLRYKRSQLLSSYAGYRGNAEAQQEQENIVAESEAKLELLFVKIGQLEEQYQEAQERLENAKIAARDNEQQQQLQEMEKEQQAKEQEHRQLLAAAASFSKLWQDLSILKQELQELDLNCVWDNELIGNGKAAGEERLAVMQQAGAELRQLHEPLNKLNGRLYSSIEEYNGRNQELKRKIDKLESGLMYYPREAEQVKKAINEALLAKGKQAEARLLCELLYMREDKWQDAVESYLNNQRFNIIVPPESYSIAKEAFIGLGDRVHWVGLVDTVRLQGEKPHKRQEQVKYLCETVGSENIHAKSYVDYLMHAVVCCDDAKELEQHKKAVTKDRLRYQGYVLKRMAKEEHFIGVDAIAKQLQRAKEEIQQVRSSLVALEAQKAQLDKTMQHYNEFTAAKKLLVLEQNYEAEAKALSLGSNLKELQAKIEEFKQNPLLLAMYNHVAECEAERNKLHKELTNAESSKLNWERVRQEAQFAVQELQQQEKALADAYYALLQEAPELADDVEKRYNEERKQRRPREIAYNFNNLSAKDKANFEKHRDQELIPLQQRYNATYASDFPQGLDGAARYQQEYLTLQNIDLERHKQALKTAQERCKERFRKDVLFRMKDDILKAQQQLRQMSRVMEKLEYGEESYRFAIGKSKDKELGLFYDIIMDENNEQIEEEQNMFSLLGDEAKSQVFASQLEDFMARIMQDVEARARENLTGQKSGSKQLGQYVDYRTYLDYDIIVHNSVTGMEANLSKVSGEGSGGENQAPFYVAICASLLQIYEKNPEGCIRLVLLDEAFNNMTSDRIEPMMNMFRKLNLQLVLIATAEKATAIIPYCDITYSIIKSGNRNAIEAFERVE